jgi:hypothetical protein
VGVGDGVTGGVGTGVLVTVGVGVGVKVLVGVGETQGFKSTHPLNSSP